MNRHQEQSQEFTRSSGLWLLVPVLILAILATTNYLRPKVLDEQALLQLGYVPQLVPEQVQHFELVNQRDEPVDESIFTGQWSLVFFGFTHCPDFCPTTLSVLAELEEKMHDASPQIILITVDPARDTTEILARYVAGFSPNILALTGEPGELMKVASQLHAVYQRQPAESEDANNYGVDHSLNVALIDPQGSFTGHFRIPHRVPEMGLALTQLMSL